MKRARIIAALLAIILVALVVVMVCLVNRDDEPSWHGKTLTEWIDQLQGSMLGSFWKYDNEADHAIKEIGTNGFPTLFKMVEARDGAIKARLIRMINGQNLIHVRIKSAYDKHTTAWGAFLVLGTNAVLAVPQLLRMTANTNTSPEDFCTIGQAATTCLHQMMERDAGGELRGALANCLKSSDFEVKRGAGQFLHRFFSKDAARLGVYEIFPDLKPGTGNSGPTKAPVTIR